MKQLTCLIKAKYKIIDKVENVMAPAHKIGKTMANHRGLLRVAARQKLDCIQFFEPIQINLYSCITICIKKIIQSHFCHKDARKSNWIIFFMHVIVQL